MEFGGNAEIMPMPKHHLRKTVLVSFHTFSKGLSIQESDEYAPPPSCTESERGMLAGNVKNSMQGEHLPKTLPA